MQIIRFEDLNAWQEAREMTKLTYILAKTEPLRSDYGIRDQIQRAAVSVMSNIAEGFERASKPEKLQFFNIARASCGEVRSLTYVCEDVAVLDSKSAQGLRNRTTTTGRLISGLMRSLRNSRGAGRPPTPNSQLPTPNF